MTYEGYYPNDTLKAEWDVLQQVKECYIEMGCKQTLQHVKGHQDKDKPYAELTRPAQLNVDCDHFAGDFLHSTMYANRVQVPRLPCVKTQLNLRQGTITNKIKTETRIARTKQPLVEKLMKNNSWEESTFELVDWKAHGREPSNDITAIAPPLQKCCTISCLWGKWCIYTQKLTWKAAAAVIQNWKTWTIYFNVLM